MDKFAFLQLFVIGLITCVKLSQSFNVRVIFIRKYRDQPNLNSCAADLLTKTDYVGVRVKNETGVCEGLSRDLATHEIRDEAYAYAYRLQYDQLYRPPMEYNTVRWALPGIFQSGTRLEVTVIAPPNKTIIYFGLRDELSRDLMHFNIDGSRTLLDEHNSTAEWQNSLILGYFEEFTDGKLFKMLYVAGAHFINVYLNGKEFVMEHHPMLPINSIRKLRMDATINSKYFPSLVSLKFKHENMTEPLRIFF